MTTPARPVVLHLISSLNIGGAERLLVSSMQAAKADPGVSYVIVIMNEGVDAGLFADLAATGVPLYRLDRREGHLHPKYLRDLLAIIDRHEARVIHTHNEGSRFWGMLARLLRPGLKLVYTVHSEGNAINLTGWKRLAYRRLVDATVAISRFVEAETRPLGVRNLTLIENGVDLDRFLRAPRAAYPAGPLRLVSVGRFAPAKGQDILIEAFADALGRGLDATLRLAGVAADAAFHARLRAMVVEKGLQDRVGFDLNRTDVDAILAESDVFVLPSREEGFGLALVEAMAAGLPVIAARTGGAGELVRHGENGLSFPPGSVADLSAALIEIGNDAALRQRLAACGTETAARYDIRRTSEAHRALYTRLTA